MERSPRQENPLELLGGLGWLLRTEQHNNISNSFVYALSTDASMPLCKVSPGDEEGVAWVVDFEVSVEELQHPCILEVHEDGTKTWWKYVDGSNEMIQEPEHDPEISALMQSKLYQLVMEREHLT